MTHLPEPDNRRSDEFLQSPYGSTGPAARPTADRAAPHGPPLRLALVATELAVGGAERCLVNLALGLQRRGFASEVYSLRPAPPPHGAALVRQLQEAGLPVRFLDLRSRWQLPVAVSRLTREFRSRRPDLVQTFLFHANVVGALAARRAGVRPVFTGVRVADPRRGRARIERWTSGGVERIVCVSRSVADFSRDQSGLPADKLVVIPNGVDVDRYVDPTPAPPETWGARPNRRLLLSIGRLDPQKGFDRLLALAARFLPTLPAHDLAIVGAGPEEARLKRQAADLGLADRVAFVGWKPPTEIPGILAAADVVLLPSRWEGMPNVLLEAMAAARPVVACAVEGVLELLGPLAEGQAVPPDDDDAFVACTVALAQSASGDSAAGDSAPGDTTSGDTTSGDSGPGVSARGAENRRRVAEQFSLEAMIDRYERLYRHALQLPSAALE